MDISYRNGGSASAATATISVTKPSGVVDGDVIVATIQTNSPTPVAPAGWVQRSTANTPTGANPCYLYTRVASGEPASWTFGNAGGTFCAAIVDAFSGMNQTTPMDATVTVGTGTAATVTFPNITTVSNRAWHYASWADDGVTTGSTPAGYNARTALGAGGMSGYDNLIAPAGLVTGITKTGGTSWVAFSTALRPYADNPSVTVIGVSP